MAATLTLPRLGETMESGRVVGWLKAPGQAFRRGETLVEIESDKTVVELPALADGVLLEILAAEGEDITVGAPLCRYEGEAIAEPSRALPATPVAEAPPVAAPAPTTTARIRATPVARRLAAAHDLLLAEIAGTGRRGRIEAADVRAVIAEESDEPAMVQPQGRIAYRVWSPTMEASATVVLLHGFAGDKQSWAGLAPLLNRAGVAVVAPDLPGHGATSIAADNLPALAQAIAAFLDARHAAPVHLVGHSLGGAVAAYVAQVSPNRVARLTLLAPAGLDSAIDADFVHGMAQARSAGGLAHLLRRLAVRPPALSPTQLAAMADQLAQGRLTALAKVLAADGRQQIDIVPLLQTLPMPVRIVWGLEDKILTWLQVARAPSRIAVHLVAGAGHMIHWDQPNEVASLLA